MKIYTKGGDKGTTALFGGTRVSKSETRIEAYGTVDELNSYIGLISDFNESKPHIKFFISVQETLFTLGAILAADPSKPKLKKPDLTEQHIKEIEDLIDDLEMKLEPLKTFILPGGHEHISQTHIARTVCRRAERATVRLNNEQPIDPLTIQYLNRLSDLLFVYARVIAKELNIKERPWIPKS